MQDNRTPKVKAICAQHVDAGCRKTCPLADPCKTKPGDTKEAFDERMNKAADDLSSANNIITNWSWDKPVDTGDYLACYGDVETPANVHFARVLLFDGELVTEDGTAIADYNKSFKWAKLVYAPSEIEEDSNES